MALFSRFGVELEYMIVDGDSLDVRPIADQVLSAAAGGGVTGDVDRGPIGWSNELTLHVIELKCNGPAATLAGLERLFQQNVAEVNRLLEPLHGRLLPTGMHPWMDPTRETRIWPHDYNVVYSAFDRIFGCQGHGWSNLQALHLNLPFDGDEEFGRLHAAVRLLLPLLPALAASSPMLDGRTTGVLDNRLEVYRTNSQRIPLAAASVIPEPAYTQADYQKLIFEPLFAQIAPFDPEGTLRDEWLNARGAIARFSRGSIEIRVLDVQEHPAADLAICQLVTAVLKALVEERWSPLTRQQAVATDSLSRQFIECVRSADETALTNDEFLEHFAARGPVSAGDLWRRLAADLAVDETMSPACRTALNVILETGPLSRRILQALGPRPTRDRQQAVYGRLADCLRDGRSFVPDAP